MGMSTHNGCMTGETHYMCRDIVLERNKYKEALELIKTYAEVTPKEKYEQATVWSIANKALGFKK